MRALIAIFLFPIFLLIFLFAMTINQVLSTVASEDLIVRILDEANIYDYFYDELLTRLSIDLLEREYEVSADRDGYTFVNVLSFDQPDLNPKSLKMFVDDVLPRDYLRREVGENLGVSLAYLQKEENGFTVDLEAQDRVRAIPLAAERLLNRTSISDEVVEDLIVPNMLMLNNEVLEPAFGLGFDRYELDQIAFLLFAPEWIDNGVIGVTRAVAPYLADDSDEFQFTMRIEDRVVIAGEILKSKLRDDEILYRLVFTHMVSPLLGQALGLAHSVGFGITLTNEEVVKVMEAIAPRQWVKDHGDGIIDELTAYLVNADDEISYNISLKERKEAASFVLTELVTDELRSAINDLSPCQSEMQLKQASRDFSRRAIPRCSPGGQSSTDQVVDSLQPLLRMEVENFVNSQVPDDLNYSHAFFTSTIGGNGQVMDNLRQYVADGVEFSDQDLLDSLAGMGYTRKADLPEQFEGYSAEDLVDLISEGIVFTDADLIEQMDEPARQQLEDVRSYLATAMSFRWLVWLLILAPLLLLAYVAADRWSSRLRWAGAILAVSAALTYLGISILWSSYEENLYNQIPTTYDLGVQIEPDFPLLAEELKADGPVDTVMRIVESWQDQLKNQTIPWIFLGVLAFAIGTGIPSRPAAPQAPLISPREEEPDPSGA